MHQNHRKQCWLPWRMFRIMSDGDITMCCSNRSIIGNVARHPLSEIWNSENAIQFRSLIACGKYVEAGCATCSFWYTFNNYLFDFPESEFPLTAVQAQNRKIQLNEFLSGNTRLASSPSMLFIQPSYLCNLNCVMCNQKHVHKEANGAAAVMPGLMDYIEVLDPFIENIILQGGEPLLVPEILEYLEKVALGEKNHSVTLNTNGQLFHRHEGMLSKIRRLHINFSIDAGSQEIYESIRVGGDWGKLVQNVERAVDISNKANKEWSVNIQNLIMKSNIEYVNEMVKFWAYRIPSQKIYPILGADNVTENIFIYNHLLEQVPAWRESLNESIKLAEDQKLYELGLGLQYCMKLLECGPLLTKSIYKLLSESMDEKEFLHYYNNIAAYKIARVNGFTDQEYYDYVRLRYKGAST